MQLKFNYILLFVFFVFSAKNILAQQDINAIQQLDTVNISDHFPDKNRSATTFSISSGQKIVNEQNDIGELLQISTPVQINSYGLGNTSSISVRGANDDHTNVYWNGLKINSLSLGGTDISLLPIESGDEIILQTNTSSLGGDLNILSKPDWNNRFSISARSDFGSFLHFRNSIGLKAGSKKVQFQSTAFYLTAKNNFPYTDHYKFNSPTDTADHNDIKAAGNVNAVFIQLKRQNYISVGTWFQQKNKDIPSAMGGYAASNKFQKDLSVRYFINWEKYTEKSLYHVSFSHSYDALKYTDQRMPTDTFFLINSSYNTHRISNMFYAVNTFKHGLSLTSGYVYNLLLANVKEYANKAIDHVGEVYGQLTYRSGNLKTNLKLSQPFSSFKYIRPQVYADASYTLSSKKYAVFFSYSDKYRFPDLNDRYWSPGGDPQLKPETGWTLNLGHSFDLFPGEISKHQVKAQASVYYSRIQNNIVWTPVTNIIWSPKNLKSTHLYGIESQFSYSYHSGNGLLFSINSIYNFNRAQILKEESNAGLKGHYLRYKPQHTLKTTVYFEDRYFGVGFNYQYVSLRYTDEENFEFFALKPYHLADMFITFKGELKHHQLQFIFKINNLSNVSYESIRSYAQPLRYYTLSFIYNFKKQN